MHGSRVVRHVVKLPSASSSSSSSSNGKAASTPASKAKPKKKKTSTSPSSSVAAVAPPVPPPAPPRVSRSERTIRRHAKATFHELSRLCNGSQGDMLASLSLLALEDPKIHAEIVRHDPRQDDGAQVQRGHVRQAMVRAFRALVGEAKHGGETMAKRTLAFLLATVAPDQERVAHELAGRVLGVSTRTLRRARQRRASDDVEDWFGQLRRKKRCDALPETVCRRVVEFWHEHTTPDPAGTIIVNPDVAAMSKSELDSDHSECDKRMRKPALSNGKKALGGGDHDDAAMGAAAAAAAAASASAAGEPSGEAAPSWPHAHVRHFQTITQKQLHMSYLRFANEEDRVGITKFAELMPFYVRREKVPVAPKSRGPALSEPRRADDHLVLTHLPPHPHDAHLPHMHMYVHHPHHYHHMPPPHPHAHGPHLHYHHPHDGMAYPPPPPPPPPPPALTVPKKSSASASKQRRKKPPQSRSGRAPKRARRAAPKQHKAPSSSSSASSTSITAAAAAAAASSSINAPDSGYDIHHPELLPPGAPHPLTMHGHAHGQETPFLGFVTPGDSDYHHQHAHHQHEHQDLDMQYVPPHHPAHLPLPLEHPLGQFHHGHHPHHHPLDEAAVSAPGVVQPPGAPHPPPPPPALQHDMQAFSGEQHEED